MPRVLIMGGGPAGLAAAEALLTAGCSVEIFTDRAYLGGKAASWELGGGLVAENGQHVALGFYRELQALLERSGVSWRESTVSNRGRFLVWEDRDQRTHRLHLGASPLRTLVDGFAYTGWTLAEKLNFAAFLARVGPRVAAGLEDELDEVCMSAWCLQKGLSPSILRTNLFRSTRDAQLNWPGEISAWSLLKGLQNAGRDFRTGEGFFPAGGMSRIWWEPIAHRVEALGGRIHRLNRLTRLHVEGDRLAAISVAPSRCEGHDPPPGELACHQGDGARIRGFDAVIVAIPPLALREILGRDPALLQRPELAGSGRLSPCAPLSLHVWHRAGCHPPDRTVVFGMPPPLPFVVDNKPFYEEYRTNPEIGAALHLVGQEAGYEDLDDEAVLDHSLANVRRIPGFEGMDREGVLTWRLIRNRAPHERYWNGEPGSLRFRPWPKTSVEGLFLAGDWVRNSVDFPSMEGAVRSGREAALALMSALRSA